MSWLANPVGVVVVQGDGRPAIGPELEEGVPNTLDVVKDRLVVVVGEDRLHPVEVALELGFRGRPALLEEFRPGV